MKRRKFIKGLSLSGIGISTLTSLSSFFAKETKSFSERANSILDNPIVVTTWNYPNAVVKAWDVLDKGGTALDAVEQGCRVEEADVENTTVGKGGLPDRDGNVTLDACIMNKDGNYGAVVCMQNIVHPISVARKVMEETPHVIMAGKGAEKFAISQGFKSENLLTVSSKKAWDEWKINSKYKPIINIENHDTIGMLAMDRNGDITGACSTSGLAYKMAGRVGDSPIIGSGLFVDNTVGGATATGMGEEVLKTVGSFLIVELMRQGKSPQEACEEAIERIVKTNPNYLNFQVGYIALNKAGDIGSYSIHNGFSRRVYRDGKSLNIKSGSYLE